MSGEASRVVHEADVCVIGAGAGGAVVAAELAEGGARVVLLEQGPRHDIDEFSARPPEMLARLYRDAGQTATLGSPPILLPLGRGVGGTTLVNSGTCFRTPPAVLERWAGEFGLDVDAATLAPCFERVEEAISVAEVTPELAGANALFELQLDRPHAFGDRREHQLRERPPSRVSPTPRPRSPPAAAAWPPPRRR